MELFYTDLDYPAYPLPVVMPALQSHLVYGTDPTVTFTLYPKTIRVDFALLLELDKAHERVVNYPAKLPIYNSDGGPTDVIPVEICLYYTHVNLTRLVFVGSAVNVIDSDELFIELTKFEELLLCAAVEAVLVDHLTEDKLYTAYAVTESKALRETREQIETLRHELQRNLNIERDLSAKLNTPSQGNGESVLDTVASLTAALQEARETNDLLWQENATLAAERATLALKLSETKSTD